MPDANLSPEDLRTVLQADPGAKGPDEVELVKQVASGKPLSAANRGHLESKLMASTLQQGSVEAIAGAPARVRTPTPGKKRDPRTGTKQAGRDFAVRARRMLILEARMSYPPKPLKLIAETLGISERTVCMDIEAMRQEHLQLISGQRSAELAYQLVQNFDVVAAKSIGLAEGYTSPTAKSRMMNTAIKAMECKGRMMLATGMIAQVAPVASQGGTAGGFVPGAPAGDQAGQPMTIREKARLLCEQVPQASPARPHPEAAPEQAAG